MVIIKWVLFICCHKCHIRRCKSTLSSGALTSGTVLNPTMINVHSYSYPPQRPVWLLFLLLISLPTSVVKAQPCRVCGLWGPESVPLPDKLIGITGAPTDTCGGLEGFAVAFSPDSELCRTAQFTGHLCGCNVAPDSCSLCWDGSDAPNGLLELSGNYTITDFIPSSLPLSGNANCEQLQSFLHFNELQDSTICLRQQRQVGEICGCPPLPTDSTNTTIPQNVTDPTMAPTPPRELCSVCRDGGVMAYPERLVSLNDDSPDLSCREWEGFANVVTLNSADCDLFRLYSSYCGCPPETAVCNVCPNGEHVPNPTRALNWFATGAFVSTRETTFQQTELDMITCDLMDSFVATEEGLRYIAGLLDLDSDLFCMAVQLKSWICGCSPDWRQYVLTWCYRISGMLSFLVRSFHMVCVNTILSYTHVSRRTRVRLSLCSMC